MKKGTIPITSTYELQYYYYDKDANFKYFNRKFEIFLLEKKTLKRNYILHMDNTKTTSGNWAPHIYTSPDKSQEYKLGVTTLNWGDIKKNFSESIIRTIGEENRDAVKKAVGKLLSPKM